MHYYAASSLSRAATRGGYSKGESTEALQHKQSEGYERESQFLLNGQERDMVLTLLLMAIAMVVALGTALYLAYVETEADFPIRRVPHHGVRV